MIAPVVKGFHWYTRAGEAFYSLPDGKPVTLREARKEKAFPSSTSILGVIRKPLLEAWLVEQGILSSLTLPKIEGENMTDFAHRAAKDSKEQTRNAMAKGTDCHQICEDILLKRPVKQTPYTPFILDWIDDNVESVESVEKVVVNQACGYGGKLDFCGTVKGIGKVVADFKTQNVRNGKPAFYDEWPLQLESYRQCLPMAGEYKLLSVVIPSGEPAPLQTKLYEESNYLTYFETFLAAFRLWKYINKYDPLT